MYYTAFTNSRGSTALSLSYGGNKFYASCVIRAIKFLKLSKPPLFAVSVLAMWLLNTLTLKLEEFHQILPKYAILSHRWVENKEATFGDVVESSENMEGHRKLRDFCRKARDANYGYVWADTCCIDKKSSAELSEAINSMYMWYKEADKCYVYLADIKDGEHLETSSWFSRGWTLQELLAPHEVLFFDSGWRRIASKQEMALRLERITAIPQEALQKFDPLDYCVAIKMSWAAGRRTSRDEDLAYCLLGIFDINMPLIYGEGSKAFQRLQEEIMKSSTGSSLFLWQGTCCNASGMLAANPSCFCKIPDCLNQRHLQTFCKMSEGWTYNNAGMTMTGMVRPYFLTADGEAIFILFLQKPFTAGPPQLGVFLQKATEYRRNLSYRRVAVDDKMWIDVGIGTEMELARRWPVVSRAQQLFVTRESVIERCSAGTCGFHVAIKPGKGFHYVARGRFNTRPSDKLKDWPASSTVGQGSPELVFRSNGNLP
ncbi:hypothetical protein LTR22_027028 [Elasticomyces elasticus]|nr:hypothetical protein LTR22_027028 [Elasticomyces elasticus]KAK4904628.1 hypothetical protein LTR49_025950 [Elasticomyces elasticus]KAK5734800.1 hypothetical protein LTS12_026617 [Elasticomyces elasticus]